MSTYKHREYEDVRNYDAEARDLIKSLSTGQLHELYEICFKKSQRANSETRDKELNAVMSEIMKHHSSDAATLNRIKNGYKSEMAATAKATDGYTKPARKKV